MVFSILDILSPYKERILNLSAAEGGLLIAGYMACCASRTKCEPYSLLPIAKRAASQDRILSLIYEGGRKIYSIKELLNSGLDDEALEVDVAYLESTGYVTWDHPDAYPPDTEKHLTLTFLGDCVVMARRTVIDGESEDEQPFT
jgi:hypothetical protein